MKLSEHFTLEEFRMSETANSVSQIETARFIAETILEPVREHFGKPVVITSGFRDADRNAAAGGKKTSYHEYDDRSENGVEFRVGAADFKVVGEHLVNVFDFIRKAGTLPFHKVILEYSGGRAACIHVQVRVGCSPTWKRRAFFGETGDGQSYPEVECV
jgi:hypothetical protein